MAISKIGSDALAAGAPSRSQLPAGTVLQVVQGSLLGGFTTSSGTAVATGLSASITPTSSSSKILIAVVASGVMKNAGNAANGVILWLYKNASNLQRLGEYIGYTNTSLTNDIGSANIDYLDAPATTSSITYSLYMASNVSGQSVNLNAGADYSSIVLMEIAA